MPKTRGKLHINAISSHLCELKRRFSDINITRMYSNDMRWFIARKGGEK